MHREEQPASGIRKIRGMQLVTKNGENVMDFIFSGKILHKIDFFKNLSRMLKLNRKFFI